MFTCSRQEERVCILKHIFYIFKISYIYNIRIKHKTPSQMFFIIKRHTHTHTRQLFFFLMKNGGNIIDSIIVVLIDTPINCRLL